MSISLVSLAARLVHVQEDWIGWDTYARRVVKALFVLLILLIKFFVLQRGEGKDQTVSTFKYAAVTAADEDIFNMMEFRRFSPHSEPGY